MNKAPKSESACRYLLHVGQTYASLRIKPGIGNKIILRLRNVEPLSDTSFLGFRTPKSSRSADQSKSLVIKFAPAETKRR